MWKLCEKFCMVCKSRRVYAEVAQALLEVESAEPKSESESESPPPLPVSSLDDAEACIRRGASFVHEADVDTIARGRHAGRQAGGAVSARAKRQRRSIDGTAQQRRHPPSRQSWNVLGWFA